MQKKWIEYPQRLLDKVKLEPGFLHRQHLGAPNCDKGLINFDT